MLAVAGGLALPSSDAAGETYPAKPIRILVGYPAGAQSDTTARLVGTRLGEILGQSFVVENRGGAGATIAAEAVAHSTADGYTLLLGGSSNMALAPLIYGDLRYDPVRDFVPIGRIVRIPWVIAVSSKLPVTTLPQLVAYGRAHPGELTFADSTTATQLAVEMMMSAAGVKVIRVPYKSTAPALLDVIGGRVDFTLADLSILAPHTASGTVRLLATTGDKRSREAPELPTVSEQGIAGFSAYSWNSLVAPRDTPADVVAKLRGALRQALCEREFRESLERMGFEPVDEEPEALGPLLKSEIERYRKLVDETGIRINAQ